MFQIHGLGSRDDLLAVSSHGGRVKKGRINID